MLRDFDTMRLRTVNGRLEQSATYIINQKKRHKIRLDSVYSV